MRLPDIAHTSRPWRIHELTRDFRLEDVWELPVSGAADEFPRLLGLFASRNPEDSSSGVVRLLFAVRRKLGERLGWDEPAVGLGARVPTLRDRLPEELRDHDTGPAPEGLPFVPLYRTDDEWAAEIANKTVHGVVHLSWVPQGDGTYRAHMAIYVKPNGLLGRAYLAGIKPFRYLIVYPALLRGASREWERSRKPDAAELKCEGVEVVSGVVDEPGSTAARLDR